MDTPQFLLGYESITRATLVILGITFTFCLWQIKNKSRATYLLIISFAFMTLSFAALFAPLWSNFFEPLLVMSLVVSQGFLVQFAYHFPHKDQPRESWVALASACCLFLTATGIGSYYNYLYFTVPSAIEKIFAVYGLLYLTLLLSILTTIGFFLRQTIHRIRALLPREQSLPARLRQTAVMLVFPPTKDVRILRNFVIGISLGLVPGAADPISRSGLLGVETIRYMVDLGLLCMFFILFITYINSTHESLSFIIRLVSVPLITLLVMFGAVGLIAAIRLNKQSEHERQLQVVLAYHALIQDDLTALPKPVIYIAAKETAGENSENPYRLIFSSRPDFHTQFLVDEDAFRQNSPELFTPDIPLDTSDAFRQMTALNAQNFLRYDGNPAVSAPQYLCYTFLYDGTFYEIGFHLLDQQRSVHDIATGLIHLLLASSLFILFVFPRFFRKTLVNPLNTLLDGIRQADADDQEIVIPVQYEDEIGFLTRTYNQMIASLRQGAEALRQANAELETRVEQRTAELSQANTRLTDAHERILDSIRYAELIQHSILPNPEEIQALLPNSFFLWIPRDIVGGDFYQLFPLEDGGRILMVGDCTGHGVPGGFMTMLSASALQRIITGEQQTEPGEILAALHKIIKKSLRQDTNEAKSDDGLEGAVCLMRPGANTLYFAGAKLSLFILHQGTVRKIRGDRKLLGYKRSEIDAQFTTHSIPIREGMRFYLFSDGIVDQLGGTRERPFGEKRLLEVLLENSEKPFIEQKTALTEVIRAWQGDYERQDDMTVIGFQM